MPEQTVAANTEPQKCSPDGTRLLGDLLGKLRKEKKMSLLMACREIKQIEICGNAAVVDVGENCEILDESVLNEIRPFFEQFGLSIKLKKKQGLGEELKILQQLLGGRLEIK